MSGTQHTNGTPSIFGAAALLMAGRTIAFVATFFTPVLLVRLFTASEFGTYKQLFLVFGTIYPIAQFGMAESLFYFLPGAGPAAGRLVANSVALLGGVGLASTLALIAVSGGIARALGNPSLAAYLPLVGAFCLPMLAAAGLEIVMTARGRYGPAAATYGVSDIARAVCLIVPALVFRRLDAVLAGAVLFACLRLIWAGTCFRRMFKSTFRLDAALLLKQLAYGVPFGLAVVLEIAQANYHQYAVAHYFNAATFAVYAVGCLQIPLVDFVATSAGSVMMVQFAQARQEGRNDLALDIWLDTTRKLALIFFPLVAIALVGARELIVLLFTERYAASVSVFEISLAAIALSTFATDAVLRAYAQTPFLMLLYAIKLTLVAALVVPCLTTFGLPGAILATMLALALSKALALVRIRQLLGCGVTRLLPWGSLTDIARVSFIAALAGLVVKWPLRASPLAALVVSTLVTAGVALALLLNWGLVNDGERSVLAGWLRGAIGRAPDPVESGS